MPPVRLDQTQGARIDHAVECGFAQQVLVGCQRYAGRAGHSRPFGDRAIRAQRFLQPGECGVFQEANAIMVKMHDGVKGPEGKKWQSVRVEDDGALTGALERLDEAYRSAR